MFFRNLLSLSASLPVPGGKQASAVFAAADGLSSEDLIFLQSAARAGMTEIRLEQLAQQRASSQAVKNLGQRMVDDHTRARQELADIAQRKGVMLPAADEAGLEASPLSPTTGAEFDSNHKKRYRVSSLLAAICRIRPPAAVIPMREGRPEA